jgi:hypothetical protein
MPMTGKRRLRLTVLVSLALIVLSGLLSLVSAESRLALVIGNGAYSKETPLRTPPNDARLMAETLRSLHFELFGGQVYIDVTQTRMRRLIRDFVEKLDHQSVGLFYYSGHGMQADNRNFILPVNVDIEDEVDIRTQGVSIEEEVLGRMSQAEPIISIVFLDACRNNRFEKRIKGFGTSKGLEKMSAELGSIIGFASQPNEVALESKGKFSYFTDALAQEIVKPGLSIHQVLLHVRGAVRDATDGKQIPNTSENLLDDFYLSPVKGQAQPQSDIDNKKDKPSHPTNGMNEGKPPPDENIFPIPTANIKINGSPDDWRRIEPVFKDPRNDESTADFPGTDLRAFYLAKDNQYLYLAMDLYDGPPQRNLDTWYFFVAQQQPSKVDIRGDMDAAVKSSEGNWSVWTSERGDGGRPVKEPQYYPSNFVASSSNFIEWKVPLEAMGNLNGRFVRVYIHVMIQGAKQNVSEEKLPGIELRID